MIALLLALAQDPEPFRVGAWVGADTYAWGDLRGMGDDSNATIEAICKDLADLNCNTVWVSGFSPFFAEKPLIGTWLDTAGKHGLRVVIQGSGFPYAIPKGEENLLERTRAEVVPFWEDVARTHRKHPALLAYCPVEEIGDNVENGETPTLDALAEVGRAVAKIDPDHPVVTIHIASWISVAREEAKIRGRNMRTLVTDLYVFTEFHDWADPNLAWKTPDDATRGFLEWTGNHATLARETGVPLWMFAQANETTWVRRIDGKLESRGNFKMPGEAEMRFQVWATILSGAKGLFFFPYNSMPQPSEENRRELPEWEYGRGMRTLDGKPTESHAGLKTAAKGIDWVQIGRLVPDGDPIEVEGVVGRRFRGGQAVLVNRDLSKARKPPASLLERLKVNYSDELPAGGGVRLDP